MLNALTGRVVEVVSRRPGIEDLRVEPDPADHGGHDSSPSDAARSAARLAINLTDLSGPAAVGDRVLVNTTALDLGLGTGGRDFVIANLTRAE